MGEGTLICAVIILGKLLIIQALRRYLFFLLTKMVINNNTGISVIIDIIAVSVSVVVPVGVGVGVSV